jgi:hypothetical protein
MGPRPHIQAIPPYGQKYDEHKKQDEALRRQRLQNYEKATRFLRSKMPSEDDIEKRDEECQRQREPARRRLEDCICVEKYLRKQNRPIKPIYFNLKRNVRRGTRNSTGLLRATKLLALSLVIY